MNTVTVSFGVAVLILGMVIGWNTCKWWDHKDHVYEIGDYVVAAGATAEIIGIGRARVYTIDYGPDGSGQPGIPRICVAHEDNIRPTAR